MVTDTSSREIKASRLQNGDRPAPKSRKRQSPIEIHATSLRGRDKNGFFNFSGDHVATVWARDATDCVSLLSRSSGSRKTFLQQCHLVFLSTPFKSILLEFLSGKTCRSHISDRQLGEPGVCRTIQARERSSIGTNVIRQSHRARYDVSLPASLQQRLVLLEK